MKTRRDPKTFFPSKFTHPWKSLVQTPGRAEFFEVKTQDGLVLALRRVRAFGRVDAVAGANRPAVMLLHGLASNHRGFHFRGRSLAEWLARRGFDVWLPELRGHGDSQFHGNGWRFGDYLRYDIPAILATIQAHACSEKVHWVGHSMGGMVLMSYGLMNPTAPIGQAVTLGSALSFKPSSTRISELLRIREALEHLGIFPYRAMMRAAAPMVGRAVRFGKPFQVWPTNIEPDAHRKLYANCFEDIPATLLASLATGMDAGGISLDDGFRVLDNASNFKFPLRMLAASKDAQIPPEAVENTAKLMGSTAHCMVMGPDSPGKAKTREHYGHWGFMVGRNAEHETWPLIADWLKND